MTQHFNLAEYCIARTAGLRPNATALCFAEQPSGDSSGPQLSVREWSFAEVEDRILEIAAAIRQLDARPGERFLVRLPHSPEFAFAFFGAIAAGLIAVPASPKLTNEEIAFLIQDAQPALICHDGTLPLPDPELTQTATEKQTETDNPFAPRRLLYQELSTETSRSAHDGSLHYTATRAEDPAFLVYTSGTTGRPKGVLHAQRSVLGRRPMIAGWSGLGPEDRLLHAGQLNWTYSLGVGLMDPWSVGAASLLCAVDNHDPGIWVHLMTEMRATIFAAVPSLYRRILKYSKHSELQNIVGLRHGLTAGEALAPELHAAWVSATGKPLYEALGMSEVSTYISSGPGTATRPGSPGRPQPGRTIAIIKESRNETVNSDPQTDSQNTPAGRQATPIFCETGEPGLLAVRRDDPGLMLGYWNRVEEEDLVYIGDWFVGGDRAALDEFGYVQYLGRSDDLMNSFGYRVAPIEVERVLEKHPRVIEVAVCETSPAPGIRLITAFVVSKDSALNQSGHRPMINDEEQSLADRIAIEKRALQAYAAEYLADYKCPREIIFRSDLPRTANGKVIKHRLTI